MTAEPSIEISNISKEYKLYRNQSEMIKDWSYLHKLMFWKNPPAIPIKKALDNISLKIYSGERIGLIGRNGAGKTTLLKLINGMISPTSGKIKTQGKIQTLMRTGGLFHPDLTGENNVKNCLLYNGLRGSELQKAYDEIIDFAELGDFIKQPVQNYSLGMASRLSFAAATSITPEILIIDEVLGAGDSYFAQKSLERMKKLTNSGCTLLLVSHSRSQILDFCDKAIWLEDGRIRDIGEVGVITENYEKDLILKEQANQQPKDKNAESSACIQPPEHMRKSHFKNLIEKELISTYKDIKKIKSGHYINSLKIHNGINATNILRTGEKFLIELKITNKDPLNINHIYDFEILFFDERAQIVSSTEVKQITSIQEEITVEIDLSPCQLGHRIYYLFCALKNHNQIIDYLTDIVIKIIDTNDSDPPLIHYPADWYFNNANKPVKGRVSGIQ